MRVASRPHEAQGVSSFELVDAAGGTLPAFTAGAHLDVHLPNGMVRPYSLGNSPGDRGQYMVCVLHEPASRGGSRGEGMPFGLQIVGPLRGDLKVLAASLALEQAFAGNPLLRRPRPDLAALLTAQPKLDSIVTAAPPVHWGDFGKSNSGGASVV